MRKINRLFDINKKKPSIEDKPKALIGHKIYRVTFSHNGSTKLVTLHASSLLSNKNSVESYMKKYHKDCKIIEIEEVSVNEDN